MKTARHATSIALVIAALGLAAYAWRDRASVTDTERAMRENNVFPAWRREDVTRVEIDHGAEKIVLERVAFGDAGDRAWRMTSPRNEPADGARVDHFLGTLEFATVVRKLDATPGAALGLDAPRARGTIAMGGVTYRFALGAPAPTPAGAAYFRMDGGVPVVVGAELASDLMKDADALRARGIVPYLSLDLAKLEVRSASGALVVERKDERTFALPALGGARASREKLDRVWRALGEARAEAFLADDAGAAESAVRAPRFTVVMTPMGERPRGELVVGGECPGHADDVVVVRTAPTKLAACAPKGIVDGLGVTADAVLDTRVFTLGADEVEAVRLEPLAHGQPLDLARKGSGWRERAPEARDLSADEADAVTQLAADIARADGKFKAITAPGAAPPDARVRVTLTRADEKGREELAYVGWTGDAPRDAFVVRAQDGAVLLVSPDVARALVPRATSLRPRALWPQPIAGKPTIELTTACDGTKQQVTRDGDAWRLAIDGTSAKPDAAAILGAIDQLSRARAESWVADEDDGTFGIGACEVRLTYKDDAGPRTVGISFGAEGEGGTYARLVGDHAVFVAPLTLRGQVAPSFLERHALTVDPYSIVSIDVARGGARRSLDPRARDDAGLLLGDDLAGLVTEVVHLGAPRAGELPAPVEVTLRLAPDAGRADVRYTVGAEVTRGGRKMRLLRVPGVDATLAAPADSLARVLATVGGDRRIQ